MPRCITAVLSPSSWVLLNNNRMRIARPSLMNTTTSMMARNSNHHSTETNMKNVERMQEVLRNTSSWEMCWVENITPWDIGGVTPIVAELVRRNDLPEGRALVPGCGSGHDAIALASSTRCVVGLDISTTAIKQACENLPESKAKMVDFICTDFFNYKPAAPFNLILDYTFFCALEPRLRPLWASKMSELLDADGELITIMFPLDDHDGGPPYPVSVEAYERVLFPEGFVSTYIEENLFAIEKRKGREYLGRWQKIVPKI